MGKLTSDVSIQMIKDRIDIISVAEQYIQLQRDGAGFKACCPFHSEDTASFKINPNTQSYKCFGCGEGGDVIEFVMKLEGISFPDALRKLAERAGVTLEDFTPEQREAAAKKHKKIDQFRWLNNTAQKYYESVLWSDQGKEALAYMRGRGFSDETIKAWGIGYSLPGGGLRGQLSSIVGAEKKDQVFASAVEVGLLGEHDSGHYERFRGRVMFPITDATGNVLGFGGRALDWSKADKYPKYLNTETTDLFKKSGLLYGLPQSTQRARELGYIVVVEGYTDVMMAHQHNLTNVVACLGTAFTEDHAKLAARHQVGVVLRFDNDAAGFKAAEKSARLLVPTELDFRIDMADLESFKDLCECLNSPQPPREESEATDTTDTKKAPGAPESGLGDDLTPEAIDHTKEVISDAPETSIQKTMAEILQESFADAVDGWVWLVERALDRAGQHDVAKARVVAELSRIAQLGSTHILCSSRLKRLAKRSGVSITEVKEAGAPSPEAARRSSPQPPEKSEATDTTDTEKECGEDAWGGMKSPRSYTMSDKGNAQRVFDMHSKNILYCSEWGEFVCWNGQTWENREGEAVMQQYVAETIETMWLQSKWMARQDDEDSKAFSKHVLRSESTASRGATAKAVSWIDGVRVPSDVFDRDPYLLNVKNGMVDLKTGKLVEHDRSKLCTNMLDIEYKPDADCPTWKRFLLEIMCGDQDMVDYLQRAIGYTITGEISEQCLFFMYGCGSNGKSTFIETIQFLLGHFGHKAPIELIIAKRNASPIPVDVAGLQGKRMAVPPEISNGEMLDEGKVKELTGSKELNARFLNQNPITFTPTHKLWLYGNHKPLIKGTDDGIWRRLHMIPFDASFSEEQKDKDLHKKLEAEIEGILNWAVAGSLIWHENKRLNAPGKVVAAGMDYRASMDKVRSYIDENCVSASEEGTMRENFSVGKQELYDHYKENCLAVGDKPFSLRNFAARLVELGYEEKRTKHGRFWIGLKLCSFGYSDFSPCHESSSDF